MSFSSAEADPRGVIGRARRGFTLLELLVTIGLILLLASLLVVALSSVQNAAAKSASKSALRQMMTAYTGYSTDHSGVLLPGFVGDGDRLKALGLRARRANDVYVDSALVPGSADIPSSPSDASAYVWRLAEYMDDSWKTLVADYRSRALEERLAQELEDSPAHPGIYGPATAGAGDIGIARVPSFGLNSVFLGGDDYHGGNIITDRNPWTNPANALAVTRLSQVRNPDVLTVFAPAVHWAEEDGSPADQPVQDSDLLMGTPELRPPMLGFEAGTPVDLQWEIIDGGAQRVGSFTTGGGFPVARWGGQSLPVAHLDGNITTVDRSVLATDFRRWNPLSGLSF